VAIPSINNLAASRLFFLDTVHPVVIIVVRLLVSMHLKMSFLAYQNFVLVVAKCAFMLS